MFLFAHLPLLALAEPGATRMLNTTELGPFIRPIPASLNLPPIPNPFPVPNTDITLDFVPQPGAALALPKDDVIDCVILAKEHLETLIREQGDRTIGHGYELTYGLASVEIYSENPPMQAVTYHQALSVLLGLSLKMAREGYRYRHTRVLHTGDGELLGTAVVRRAVL